MPEQWNRAIISPTYNKGDKMEYFNYLEISLLKQTYEMFIQLVIQHMEPYVEDLTEHIPLCYTLLSEKRKIISENTPHIDLQCTGK